jgi:hypothetical protein
MHGGSREGCKASREEREKKNKENLLEVSGPGECYRKLS